MVERSYAPPGTGQYAAAYANVDIKFEDVAGVGVEANLVAMHVADHKHGYLAIVGAVVGLADGKYQVEIHSGRSCRRTKGLLNPVKKPKARVMQGPYFPWAVSRKTMKTRKRNPQETTKEVVAGRIGSFDVQEGVGNVRLDSRLLSLRRGYSRSEKNVAGRVLVIRDDKDKDIVACGVINVVGKGDVEWHG